MVSRSKIKWVALMGLALSMLSLGTHFLLARYSVRKILERRMDVQIISWKRRADEAATFPVDLNQESIWGPVKSMEFLRSFALPRKAYNSPTGNGNGYIFVHIKGGFHQIRTSICDAVAVARILNATLIIPELEEVSLAQGISSKFPGFDYIYDKDWFISKLANDVTVVKGLPHQLRNARKENTIVMKYPPSFASPKFYYEKILPELKTHGIVGLVISGGSCLQGLLPSGLAELQRLRCRVAYEALVFRKEIQELGLRMVERLQASKQPYLAFYPGLEWDALAYHGCGEKFQDVHTELIQYKRGLMIAKGRIKGERDVDSELQWKNGSCPIMPEEVAVILRALGYGPHTRVYLSGAEVFGGQRTLIPLRALFSGLEDRDTIVSEEEMAEVYGPENPLPIEPPPSVSIIVDEKQRLANWEKAGPRPRPLPPPPGRQKYPHEAEGWWAWVGNLDTEPEPSIRDTQERGHKLVWAALDYIVSVKADAFFPGFDRDGNGRPNLASLIMGHRAYESVTSLRTYRPDRKQVAKLIEEAGDHIYHPRPTWIAAVRDYFNLAVGWDGLVKYGKKSRSKSFLANPVPECSCLLFENRSSIYLRNNSGVSRNGSKRGSEEPEACPLWMQLEYKVKRRRRHREKHASDSAPPEGIAGFEAEAPIEADKSEKDGQEQDDDEEVDSED